MELLKGIQSLPSKKLVQAVVTVGNFDGFHLGHQRIIQLATEKAKGLQGRSVAFTFRPHPQEVLASPGIPLLTTYEEKIELLSHTGLDYILEQPFDREFAEIEAGDFFIKILKGKLDARVIVVGYDFSFGKDRKGSLGELGKLCNEAGVELCVVPAYRVGDETASSSRIRQYLQAGQVEAANRLLGRSFSYRGKVVRGEGRGRVLGFPTANVEPEKKLRLPFGVYASWSVVGGKAFPSVTNLGIRPTFQREGAPAGFPVHLETHLLAASTSLDLYGKIVEIKFAKYLRAEKKFAGVEELKRQIAADIQEAKAVVGG